MSVNLRTSSPSLQFCVSSLLDCLSKMQPTSYMMPMAPSSYSPFLPSMMPFPSFRGALMMPPFYFPPQAARRVQPLYPTYFSFSPFTIIICAFIIESLFSLFSSHLFILHLFASLEFLEPNFAGRLKLQILLCQILLISSSPSAACPLFPLLQNSLLFSSIEERTSSDVYVTILHQLKSSFLSERIARTALLPKIRVTALPRNLESRHDVFRFGSKIVVPKKDAVTLPRKAEKTAPQTPNFRGMSEYIHSTTLLGGYI